MTKATVHTETDIFGTERDVSKKTHLLKCQIYKVLEAF
jgi:hypothetical protein